MPKVFVAGRIPEAGLVLLRAENEVEVWTDSLPPSPTQFAERAGGSKALLTLLTVRVDRALLDAVGPQLKVLSNFAVGVDNIDVPEVTRRRIPLGHTPGVLTETTADLTWALLCAAARRLSEAEQYVRAGEWKTWEPTLLLGRDLFGATLGIVGFGRIGQAVARRARGFSMRTLALSRHPISVEGVESVDLPTLLRESDFVTLHAPLTPQTRHLINADALSSMKPGSILVNTARGSLIDSSALVEALRSGPLAAAALDVTDPEPLPATHPLLKLPNCLVVPHIGSATVATRDKMAIMAANNVLAGLQDQRLPHCVNPEVYDPEVYEKR